ncbi:MAG: branched-chain amino acid ABC transporter permease [Clostridiales bacterium]|nr:branched-chain amino acid ABC transporter permease [Clostridiales bacterium]
MQQAKRKKYMPALVGLVLLAALLAAVRGQQYLLTLLNFVCMYMISVSGLDILFGYSGQISLGHAAFYAAGAYTSALLTTKLGVPVWIAIAAACLVSLILGIIVALPASKLIHHFLALLTISVGQLVYIVLSRAEFTNAMTGIRSIPKISLFGFQLKSKYAFLIFMILMVALFLLIKQRIVYSRVGRAFQAIRENPVAANGIGINVQKYKIMAFAISAVFTGFAGAMYAHFVGFISPETFTSSQSVMFLTMLLFGGMGTFSGPLIGATIVTFLNESLQVLGSYRMMVYGAFILAVLLFLPHGISGIIDILRQRLTRRKEPDHADA